MMSNHAQETTYLQSLPRSLQWRIHFGQLARPLSTHVENTKAWANQLSTHRHKYAKDQSFLLRAPDGSFPDCITTQRDNLDSGNQPSSSMTSLQVNNPLSLADENPWHTHFAKMSTLQQIQMDVERVNYSEPRFHQIFYGNHTKLVSSLVSILSVWSLHPNHEHVGYRQGMHELAAICYLVVCEDANSSHDSHFSSLFEASYIEADAFNLFDALMVRAEPWYAWKVPTKIPILQRCEAVRSALAANDPQLATHLDELGIATQLFAIRWIRLLFTREIALESALQLWDLLFDMSPSLDLVDEVCVAMLIRIREELLRSGNADALRLVLNYPSETVVQGQSVSMLIDEARLVQRRHRAVRSGSEETSRSVSNSLPIAPSLSDIARGIYAQSLGAGFNRALYNVQRTVNNAYQAYQPPISRDGFPPHINGLVSQSHGRREAKPTLTSQIEAMRASNRQMGSTLTDVVSVLERHWEQDGFDSTENDEGKQTRQLELLVSLTALKHVRDVLNGSVAEFDEAAIKLACADSEGHTKTNACPSVPAPLRAEKINDPTASIQQGVDTAFSQRFQRTTDSQTPVDARIVSSETVPEFKQNPSRSQVPRTTKASTSTSTQPQSSSVVEDPLGVGFENS